VVTQTIFETLKTAKAKTKTRQRRAFNERQRHGNGKRHGKNKTKAQIALNLSKIIKEGIRLSNSK
jgi:hypothetical protein